MRVVTSVLLLYCPPEATKRRRIIRLLLLCRIRSLLRERNLLHSLALLDDQLGSPWNKMYYSRHTTSFITAVSIPPDTFDNLLAVFIPPATYARVLAKAEKALSLALKAMPDAAICWPTFDQQVVWAQATEAREPLVTGVFAFVDGKNLPVREPSSSDLQNAQYNGCLMGNGICGQSVPPIRSKNALRSTIARSPFTEHFPFVQLSGAPDRNKPD
ncbi:hypothetical protein H257_18173 [Aphanomyces astaci]|uniref:DDE Tnp4 domain-containing protein n=1 Tax=Aphanomyces astaci TaxID=112090 RepID=W4FC55_APHAT|nr:hypothetical protein H257_18173 [Aphanomyces astaci]ETV65047.1 hypothetical protein H257_18173 [Aphanomyces astaci]|eukprot:XP_009845483.1 hypothetical protein H257_18173 [Aphanomyces astaci]